MRWFLIGLSTLLVSTACTDSRQERLCGPNEVELDGRCQVRPGNDAGIHPDATLVTDSGTPDATEDSGVVADSGTNPDATPEPDAAELDASTADAGELDAQLPDAEPNDVGTPDAGFLNARISESQLDFGRTLIGTTLQRVLTIDNPSSGPVQITIGPFVGGPEYTLVGGERTETLEPGSQHEVAIEFSPYDGVRTSAILSVQLCEAGCEVIVGILGTGVYDAIECTPVEQDFGAIPPQTCASHNIHCQNTSNADSAIENAALAGGTTPEFMVDPTGLPRILAPGDAIDIPVQYCPQGFGTDSGDLLIALENPDPTRTLQTISLAGEGGGPQISCDAVGLELGWLVVGGSAATSVHCTNTGSEPLSLNRVGFAGSPQGLSVALSVGGASITVPNTLAPGAVLSAEVRFAPTAAVEHTVDLQIDTNDTLHPRVAISVHAGAVDSVTGCSVDLEPAIFDFGLVRPTTRAEGTVAVVNIGTGPCVINAGLTSGAFSFIGATSFSSVLLPGQRLTMPVAFVPPATGAFNASVSVSSNDPVHPSATIALTGRGDAVAARLEVLGSLDFGASALVCETPSRDVVIHNVSGVQVTINNVRIEAGSSPTFQVTGPSFPTTLAPDGQITVHVSFVPTHARSERGRLEIVLASGSIYREMQGQGLASLDRVDTFQGRVAPPIDVLLVVDDSGSMQPYQNLLAAALPEFVRRGDAAGVDYHIGVTTTDATAALVGLLKGSPPYIGSLDPNREQVLVQRVNVGTNGSPDEQGLFAAAQAVSNPARVNGPNAGFLRADGQLVVVILSDEEEQNATDVATLVNQMAQRPVGAPIVTVHGITGGATGCGAGFTVVDPAPRYVDAITRTGGLSESICEPDFTPAVRRIADAAFLGASAAYSLSAVPDMGSLQVRVDGQLTPARTGTVSTWFADAADRLVVFAPGRAPTPGSDVEFRYQVPCVLATCGNGALDANEACDDGDADNLDGCLTTCRLAACGDGFARAAFEGCDDGNTFPGDGCNEVCVIEGCGNGIREPGEACDDGAQNSDEVPNACRTQCVLPACHDGVVDSGEACDDSNLLNSDACVGTCQSARCGDGFVQVGVEDCDDGNTVNSDICTNACTWNAVTYNVTVTTAPFVPSTGTPLNLTTQDDAAVAVSIGFPFEFLGTPVTEANVSTNGLIAFEATNADEYQNGPIPDPTTPNGFIAWWWDDMNPRVVGVAIPSATTTVLGVAPNRIRVFTFLDWPVFSASPLVTQRVSAEIRLYETTNVVEVSYGPIVGGATDFSATVGYEVPLGQLGEYTFACQDQCSAADWVENTLVRYVP